ncbi:MAG: hypothetical protein RQ826_00075 [Xanthomonadales bacterium]|nr:hypothetical protein [Xanthomonadales bacterium]
MTGWFVSTLGDAMLAQDALEEVRSCFEAACRHQGYPADMGLFVRHVSEGRLHCEVLLYFSPAATALALEWGAVPCGPPARGGLDLLAGSDRALREP